MAEWGEAIDGPHGVVDKVARRPFSAMELEVVSIVGKPIAVRAPDAFGAIDSCHNALAASHPSPPQSVGAPPAPRPYAWPLLPPPPGRHRTAMRSGALTSLCPVHADPPSSSP